jgi:putative flippase GtrA
MTDSTRPDSNRLARRLFQREPIMFIVMGGVNTLYNLGVYLLLERVMDYNLAYTIAYVIGVFTSYYLNARFVFRQPMTVKSLLRYPLVYVVQYIVGLGLMYVFVELLHLDASLAPLPTTTLTLPITFILSRSILSQKT